MAREIALVGQDSLVRKVATLAERLAFTSHSVFIEGEQGTGREHLARFLHARGPRAGSQFSVYEFCDSARGAALDPLSEICGRTAGGTLMLRGCDRLDGDDARDVSELLLDAAPTARVILSASLPPVDRQGPVELVSRVGALSLYLPPLRTRRSDVVELSRHFLDEWRDASGAPQAMIAEDALLYLWRYDWPGNVRELRDELVAACERSRDGLIRAEHLSERVRPRIRTKPAPTRRAGAAPDGPRRRLKLGAHRVNSAIF